MSAKKVARKAGVRKDSTKSKTTRTKPRKMVPVRWDKAAKATQRPEGVPAVDPIEVHHLETITSDKTELRIHHIPLADVTIEDGRVRDNLQGTETAAGKIDCDHEISHGVLGEPTSEASEQRRDAVNRYIESVKTSPDEPEVARRLYAGETIPKATPSHDGISGGGWVLIGLIVLIGVSIIAGNALGYIH